MFGAAKRGLWHRVVVLFFFQAEDGIRDWSVTGVQTCALPISSIYMRMQIEESVYYLFTWTQGTFNFEADVRPEQQDFLVSINPESLLLEGARREIGRASCRERV